MKKILYLTIVMICGIILMPSVNALTVEETLALDPEDKIEFPSKIYSTGSELIINSSITNYKLYYQWIQMSETDLQKMENIQKEMEAITTEMEEYKNNATEEEQQTPEYTEKVQEYASKGLAKAEEYAALIPNYNDSNWQETAKIVPPANSGTHLLWVKLVNSDNTTIYDNMLYTFNSSSSESVDTDNIIQDTNNIIEDTTINENDNSINENNNIEENDNNYYGESVQTTTNPSTGISDYILYIVPIALVIGIALVLNKKTKRSY